MGTCSRFDMSALFMLLIAFGLSLAPSPTSEEEEQEWHLLSPEQSMEWHRKSCQHGGGKFISPLRGHLARIVSNNKDNTTVRGGSVKGELELGSKQVALMREDECAREATAWRWRYVEETRTRAPIGVRESSVDARLANIIYTVESAKINYNDPFRFNSGDRERDALNEQRVAGARVDDQLCGEHLAQMLDLIDDLKFRVELQRQGASVAEKDLRLDERHLRLARVLDSFGRFESGLLNGKTHSIGAHKQCETSQLLLGPRINSSRLESNQQLAVDTRFCWAKLSARRHLDESLRWRKPLVELQDPLISSAICVPSSCHTKSFKQNRHLFERLVTSQFKLPREVYIDESLELEAVYCLVDSDSPASELPLSAKLFCLFLLAWLAMLVYFNMQQANESKQLKLEQANTDGLDGEGKSSRVLSRCFHITSCWADFTGSNEIATKTGSNTLKARSDLSVLNLFKVLACAFVVYGHTSMVHFFYLSDQLRAMWEIPNDPLLASILVGVLAVDTFFVITGLLMSVLLLSKLHKMHENARKLPTISTGNLATKLIFNARLSASLFALRYLKMIPMYFLVFCFTKSLFPYLGSGPFWDHGFNRLTPVGACQSESWLSPIILSSSFLPIFRQCLTPSWSISIDLLLCMAVIPLIISAYSAPKLATLIGIISAAVAINQTYKAFGSIDSALLWELKENSAHGVGQLFNKFSHCYTLPHYRLPAMLFGCLGGYALFKYNQAEFKSWPRWFGALGTRAAIAFQIILIVALSNVHHLRDIVPRDIFRQVFPSFIALRALWSAANTALFVRLASDWQRGYLASLGKSSLFKISSKLNYAILLVHWNLVMFDAHYRDSLYYLNKWHFIRASGAIYFFTLIVGTILHLTIEAPLDRIIKYYASNGEQNSNIGAGLVGTAAEHDRAVSSGRVAIKKAD